MYALRDSTASLSRSTPYFRGKRRIGNLISRLCTNFNHSPECISKVKMQDGSLMKLDVRSRTEQFSYWTGTYDNKIISKLSSCFTKDCIVLDVGANIGFYTVPFAHKLKKLGGHVHAFEPVNSNFERLVSNISLNNIETTVSAHCLALGDDEGIIEMSMESDNHSSSGNAVMVKGEIPANYFGVKSTARLTRFDTFAKEENIKYCSLIKIDIEGAEVMFLRGGISFIKRTRPIIYGEFNSYFLPKYGNTFSDVVDIFKPLKYRFFKQVSSSDFLEVEPSSES